MNTAFLCPVVGFVACVIRTCALAVEKILTADLADSTTAVFQLLSATLTQGNMSRLGRCELSQAA